MQLTCPTIASGSGQVVLATIQLVEDNLLNISIEGLSSPLEVTSNHLMWSADRGEWVQAGQLFPVSICWRRAARR